MVSTFSRGSKVGARFTISAVFRADLPEVSLALPILTRKRLGNLD